MDETPITQRPWFYLASRGAILLVLYAVALFFQWREQVESPSVFILHVAIDIFLFLGLLLLWLAFFAQFVLPVQTFEERQKIFDRLLGYMLGSRGPAIFIKNGQVIDRAGESARGGAGVLWLDSASAAVTHTDVSFKNTFGPGVHFTAGGEKIAATVDLHVQRQEIGPRDEDNPFIEKDKVDADKFKEIQNRRMMTSGLSRDGIEVVPSISVTFKIDADPVTGDVPGSHFGYNEEAVSHAIINQAVNPNAKPNTLEYNVAWNELPAYLAADLWREFISKYKLMQLFDPTCPLPPAVPVGNPLPPLEDTEALSRPMSARDQGRLSNAVTEMLHELNQWLEKVGDACEKGTEKKGSAASTYEGTGRPGGGGKPPEIGRKTALQVINAMMKERMTNPRAPRLNRNGEIEQGWQESKEYKVLKERGIRITSVSVSNLRFPPQVENQIISQWTANWLSNARLERERIETARSYAALSGQEKALTAYASDIAYSALESKREAKGLKEVVKSLLVRSRMLLVRSDRIHRRASNELQDLEDAMQWLESNQL